MRASLCFVAPNAYAVLSGDPQVAHVGGAEVQQVLVARGLARRGHDVRFVTLDHGQSDGQQIEGIRIFKTCRPGSGLPGLRLVHPKWTHLAAAMRRADADVYYQRTSGIESGQVCLWCRHHGRRFVFGVGSDADCQAALCTLSWPLERGLYRYGLTHADAVIAQTQAQRRMLAESFGLGGPGQAGRVAVVPSCRPLPAQVRAVRPAGPPRILWVGRFSPSKRPEWCLELARRRAHLHFDIVGAANRGSEYSREIYRQAQALPNLTLHGYVPYERMDAFYQAASVLLSTSLYEGFPNTFLEAWSHGRPVVGTADPDAVVTGQGLGRVGSDLEGLAAGLDELLNDPELWARAASGAQGYVARHHSLDAAVAGYEAVLEDVMKT